MADLEFDILTPFLGALISVYGLLILECWRPLFRILQMALYSSGLNFIAIGNKAMPSLPDRRAAKKFHGALARKQILSKYIIPSV